MRILSSIWSFMKCLGKVADFFEEAFVPLSCLILMLLCIGAAVYLGLVELGCIER